MDVKIKNVQIMLMNFLIYIKQVNHEKMIKMS